MCGARRGITNHPSSWRTIVAVEAREPKPGAYRPVLCVKCQFPFGIKGTQPAIRATGYSSNNRIYQHDDRKDGGQGCMEILEGQAALRRLLEAHKERQV